MNPTFEAFAAVIGVVVAVGAILIALAVVETRLAAWARSLRQPPARREPDPRGHEPGDCWCGQVHESARSAAGDDGPGWEVA